MKVVINSCFGGFNLSPEALLWLWKKGMKDLAKPVGEYFGKGRDKDYAFEKKKQLEGWREFLASKDKKKRDSLFITVFTPDEKHVLSGGYEIKRDEPLLIQCIEELGTAANGPCADLTIVEIPDGTDYVVEEYDGNEHIAEKHQTWS